MNLTLLCSNVLKWFWKLDIGDIVNVLVNSNCWFSSDDEVKSYIKAGLKASAKVL